MLFTVAARKNQLVLVVLDLLDVEDGIGSLINLWAISYNLEDLRKPTIMMAALASSWSC